MTESTMGDSGTTPERTGTDGARRVVLFGFGVGGRFFHAPFIASTPGLALAAIVTNDPTRADLARADHPEAEVLTVDQALARLDTFDLVVVSTVNRSHVPLGLAALSAGRDVVIDKPIAVDRRSAEGLAEAADRAGRWVVPYHSRRWDGDFRTVRTVIAEGRVGTVHRFESRFERWRPVPKGGWRESVDPGDGGGLLLDLGSHLVDQAMDLFGPVETVYAEVRSVRPGVPDDDVFVALTHRSGTASHLWASAVAADLGPRFRVLGATGSYSCTGMDLQESWLYAGARPATSEPGAWGAYPQEQWGSVGALGDRTVVPTVNGDIGGFWRELVVALDRRVLPPVTAADGVRCLAVLDAARESAESGRVVRL
jgi:scyllo-inositol 2-dehydrogenase (NADP+)